MKGGLGGKCRRNRCGSEEQEFGGFSVSKVPAACPHRGERGRCTRHCNSGELGTVVVTEGRSIRSDGWVNDSLHTHPAPPASGSALELAHTLTRKSEKQKQEK